MEELVKVEFKDKTDNDITDLINMVAEYFNYTVEEVSSWSNENIISAYSDMIKEQTDNQKL